MTQKFIKMPLAAAVCGVVASSVLFQSAPVLAESLALEEVIVTAQKREQSLQDVPISVSAVSGEKMAEAGIDNLADMSAYVPNFNQATTPIGQVLTIRGISSGINQGFEQSVVQYVDEVAMGRGPMSRMPFMDMERVEILRGPQNVLFGKNSIGGAIALTTAKPSDEFEGSVQVEYEPTFDRSEVQAMISAPLTDTLGARLVVRSAEDDGFLENTSNGDDEQAREELAARLTLAWAPTDTFDATLKLEHNVFDFEGRGEEVVAAYNSPATHPIWPNMNYGQIAQFLSAASGHNIGMEDAVQNEERFTNNDEHSDNDSNQVILTMNWDQGDYTVTSVTGYIDYTSDEYIDVDLTGVETLTFEQTEKFDQFSQEIRITSPGGETVDWIAGAYFQQWNLDYTQDNYIDDQNLLSALSAVGIGSAAALGLPGFNPNAPMFTNANPLLSQTYGVSAADIAASNIAGGGTAAAGRATNALQFVSMKELLNSNNHREYESESTTYSIFGQATWNYSEELRFTLGARYTAEDKEAERSVESFNLAGATPVPANIFQQTVTSRVFGIDGHAVKDDRKEESVTATAIVEWDVSLDAMVYASVSNGFKAGGFDARAGRAADFEYEDETVITYEIGGKAELMDGRAQVNGAIFYTDYSDLQVSQFDGNVGFIVGNAAKAKSRGVEIDGRMMLTEELMLLGSMAYLDYEFVDYDTGACDSSTTLATGAVTCDRSGDAANYAPMWSGTVTLDYQKPVTDYMNLHVTLDASYRSEQTVEATFDSGLVQDSETDVNARIALEGDNWMLALVGKNLTDNDYIGYASAAPVTGTALIQAPTYSGYQVRPRTFAIQAKYNF